MSRTGTFRLVGSVLFCILLVLNGVLLVSDGPLSLDKVFHCESGRSYRNIMSVVDPFLPTPVPSQGGVTVELTSDVISPLEGTERGL